MSKGSRPRGCDSSQDFGREVSQDVIAPSYTPEAFEILNKKGGKYTSLETDPFMR